MIARNVTSRGAIAELGHATAHPDARQPSCSRHRARGRAGRSRGFLRSNLASFAERHWPVVAVWDFNPARPDQPHPEQRTRLRSGCLRARDPSLHRSMTFLRSGRTSGQVAAALRSFDTTVGLAVWDFNPRRRGRRSELRSTNDARLHAQETPSPALLLRKRGREHSRRRRAPLDCSRKPRALPISLHIRGWPRFSYTPMFDRLLLAPLCIFTYRICKVQI